MRGVRRFQGADSGTGIMQRSVKKEQLDELLPGDPAAIRSRRDIGRLNSWMGHPGIVARLLQQEFSRHLSFQLIDLGGGGGEFLLRVARRLRGRWRGVDVELVDQHDLLTARTRAEFAALKWQVRSVCGDAVEWLSQSAVPGRAVIGNLILHQFNDARLRVLLQAAARQADVFIAVEPWRAWWPLLCSRLVRLIGCGPVTAHDAPVSVQAGFAGRELSALWPDAENWELMERRAGWFSHIFVARRKKPVETRSSFGGPRLGERTSGLAEMSAPDCRGPQSGRDRFRTAEPKQER
jgi:hypothetical protein